MSPVEPLVDLVLTLSDKLFVKGTVGGNILDIVCGKWELDALKDIRNTWSNSSNSNHEYPDLGWVSSPHENVAGIV